MCFGQLYRIIVNYVTSRTDYKITKLVYINRPGFSDVNKLDCLTQPTLSGVLLKNVPQTDGHNKTKTRDINSMHTCFNVNAEEANAPLPPPPAYKTFYSVVSIREILTNLEN